MHIVRIIFSSFGGFAWGACSWFAAALLTGAGHGWTTAATWGWTALIYLPLLGASLSLPPSRAKLTLLLLAIAGMAAADLALIVGALAEGTSSLSNVMRQVPLLLAIWLFFWASPQVFAAITLRKCIALVDRRTAQQTSNLN